MPSAASATRVTDVLPQTRPSGRSRRAMIARGSPGSSPSPAASVSQSPQARSGGSAGSAEGRAAANFGPKWRAFGSVTGSAGIRVARVGQHVRAGLEVRWPPGGSPSQLSIAHRVQVGADQVERVVGGERRRVIGELLEHPGAVGGGAQRQLSPAAAARWVGLRAAAVQQAGDPRHVRGGRPARCRRPARRSRRSAASPASAWRAAPRAAGQLVPDAKQRSGTRSPGARLRTTVHTHQSWPVSHSERNIEAAWKSDAHGTGDG